MPTDPITFAQLVTPGGAAIAAAIVTGFVQLLKTNQAIDARRSGATLAFLASAVLYVVTALALQPLTADGYLGVFVTWISCGLAAVGIYAGGSHVAELIAGEKR